MVERTKGIKGISMYRAKKKNLVLKAEYLRLWVELGTMLLISLVILKMEAKDTIIYTVELR